MEGYPEKISSLIVPPQSQLIHNHDAEVYAPWRLVYLRTKHFETSEFQLLRLRKWSWVSVPIIKDNSLSALM